MKFKIPFAFRPLDSMKQNGFFNNLVSHKKNSKLEENLNSLDVSLTREQYLNVVIKSFIIFTLVVFLISSTTLILLKIEKWFYYAPSLSLLVGIFVAFSQMVYPSVYATRKQKEIEKNLIPALEDILVQLTSGVPLFSIMINISNSDYGSLSEEFKKIVKKINAGLSQSEVLEDVAKRNPSVFFRRTMWQLSNGMKAGSDLTLIVKDSLRSLNEEQLIQIQNYGNKLNPLIMFYMLISVILPALSITFLTIIASMINLNQRATVFAFVGLFIMVTIIQLMFLGIIKSVRPSLA